MRGDLSIRAAGLRRRGELLPFYVARLVVVEEGEEAALVMSRWDIPENMATCRCVAMPC